MRAEDGKIEGNLRVADGFDLHGMVTGTISVAPGRRLELHGTFCRDLVLDEGLSVHLYGTVPGDVYNRGGELLVSGSIGGTTVIDPGAPIPDLVALPTRVDAQLQSRTLPCRLAVLPSRRLTTHDSTQY